MSDFWRCPSCGRYTPDRLANCSHCGRPAAGPAPVIPPPPAPISPRRPIRGEVKYAVGAVVFLLVLAALGRSQGPAPREPAASSPPEAVPAAAKAPAPTAIEKTPAGSRAQAGVVRKGKASARLSARERRRLCARARRILSAATERYESILERGKSALPTLQYSSAMAALADIDQPGTGANRWKGFNSWIMSADTLSPANASRVQAADLFYPDDYPPAIDDWFSDLADADTDIHKWADQATDWQIGEITTDQLRAAEEKFRSDLAKVRADIRRVRVGSEGDRPAENGQ